MRNWQIRQIHIWVIHSRVHSTYHVVVCRSSQLPSVFMYVTYDFTEMGKQLLAASRDGLTEDVSQLLARSAPMTTDWLGTSPLHLAASNGHCSTAEVLMRSGCSRDAKTKVDKTPLHLSATEGHSEMTELLLKSGAEVDSKDMVGKYFLSTKLWHKLIPGMSPEGPKVERN